MEDWRRLRTQKRGDLYSLPNIFRVFKPIRMRWAGNVAVVRDMRHAERVLVGKRERNRPLGRPNSRRKANDEIDLRLDGKA